MATEIERKFLVRGSPWLQDSWGEGCLFRQGYLTQNHHQATVRIRLEGTQGQLTIKGPTEGASRAEFEYPIPLADAETLLATLCGTPLIEKTRWRVLHEGMWWEIDRFFGTNEGLVLAEIELPSETTPFSLPLWAGREVTYDPRYFNASLSINPRQKWGLNEASP